MIPEEENMHKLVQKFVADKLCIHGASASKTLILAFYPGNQSQGQSKT